MKCFKCGIDKPFEELFPSESHDYNRLCTTCIGTQKFVPRKYAPTTKLDAPEETTKQLFESIQQKWNAPTEEKKELDPYFESWRSRSHCPECSRTHWEHTLCSNPKCPGRKT